MEWREVDEKLELIKFPIHIVKAERKTMPDKMVKINNQAIYSGSLNRFARAVAVNNMKNWIKGKLSDQNIPCFKQPVILTLRIFTVINHGNIQWRGGESKWIPPKVNYSVGWDEDNLRGIWEKTIKDVLTELNVWKDDTADLCRGTHSEVIFVDNVSDRKIEIGFKVQN